TIPAQAVEWKFQNVSCNNAAELFVTQRAQLSLEDEVQETEVLLKLRGSCSPGLEQVRAQRDGWSSKTCS
ncbi:hypothetical protein Nmel_014371, partial [Mimus melanotis]